MTGLDQYVATFRARVDALGGEVLEAPGLLGCSVRRDGHVAGRALVLSDDAADALEGRVPELDVELVTVLGAAPRTLAVLQEGGAYRVIDTGTAMVRQQLADLVAPELPDGLRLVQVQGAGALLEEAVRASGVFDPDPGVPDEVVHRFLRALPSGRLLAAVDGDGAVRATAGSGRYGLDAVVVWVTTDPALRGRGIGSTMTAQALVAARESGATRATLDASDLGARIYRKLGFEAVASTTVLTRA